MYLGQRLAQLGLQQIGFMHSSPLVIEDGSILSFRNIVNLLLCHSDHKQCPRDQCYRLY